MVGYGASRLTHPTGWGAFIERDPKGHQANMAELLRWADAGKISAHVHAVYTLAETPAALKAIAARQVMGKVILRPQRTASDHQRCCSRRKYRSSSRQPGLPGWEPQPC
jgi:hypothetical protein